MTSAVSDLFFLLLFVSSVAIITEQDHATQVPKSVQYLQCVTHNTVKYVHHTHSVMTDV